MSDGVHAGLGAIQNMEAACDRFARMVVERLPSVERELRRVSEALDDRCDELRREVSSLHDEILSADEEDDTSFARSRLEDAEEELASVQRRSHRLAGAGAAITGQVRKINHLATDHAARTRGFLRGTADDLKAYLAKTQEGLSNAAFPPSRVVTSTAVSGGDAVLSAANAPHAKSIGDIVTLTDRDIDVFKDEQGPLAVEAKTKEYEQRLREYPELAGLTLEEYLAINRYSQHDYAPINEAFRTDDKTTVARWGSHIRLASRALHKLPAYNGVVYRGVNSGEFLNNYVPGQTVIEKSFTSASQDLRSILSFGKTRFEIQSKTGRDIKSCSAMQSAWAREKEVLFAPNTRFEVTGRFERDGATIIQLREL
jgi:hypothetical protein